jgi:hypothetical protein
VRALAAHDDLGVHDAVAPELEPEIGRLEQDRERCLAQPRHLADQPPEPIVRVRSFLRVIEHRGDVEAHRVRRHGVEQREHHGVTRFHVARAEPVELVAVAPRGRIALRRHGVEMSREHEQRTVAGRGAPDDAVAGAEQLAATAIAELRRDPVRDLLLVAGLARDVDERREQRGEGFGVDGRGGHDAAQCSIALHARKRGRLLVPAGMHSLRTWHPRSSASPAPTRSRSSTV